MLIFDPTLEGVHLYRSNGGRMEEGPFIPGDTGVEDQLVMNWMDRADTIGYVLPDGGPYFSQVVSLLKESNLIQLERCAKLFPGPNEWILRLIRRGMRRRAEIQHYLLCETAFFSSLPDKAHACGLPYVFFEGGIGRYGGDGLCHAWIGQQIRQRAAGAERGVSVHLGDYPSLAALHGGAPLESSLSFTPLDGLPSKTGCGAIDPSLTLYLIESGMDAAELERIYRLESGWKALAGKGLDWEELLADRDAQAHQAREYLEIKLVRALGGCLAALGGAQLIAFAAPKAETSLPFVQSVAQKLSFIGVELRQPPVREGDAWLLSTEDSPVQVLGLTYYRPRCLAEALEEGR
jgi:acetate kinase